jgi:hypothetical protein
MISPQEIQDTLDFRARILARVMLEAIREDYQYQDNKFTDQDLRNFCVYLTALHDVAFSDETKADIRRLEELVHSLYKHLYYTQQLIWIDQF